MPIETPEAFGAVGPKMDPSPGFADVRAERLRRDAGVLLVEEAGHGTIVAFRRRRAAERR